MRSIFTILLLTLLIAMPINNYGQAVQDPSSIPVYLAAGTITLDGQLTEPTWSIPAQQLKFRLNGTPTGLFHTPTGGAVVKPPYMDTSTCYVKFLRSGSNLYISLNSDDKQVCRFGDSWEGDGIFMKIKNFAGTDVEFKLYYNLAGINPDIHYEGPTYGAGAGYKKPGTTVNDSSNVDAGYSAELRINLDSLGFSSSTGSVQVLINIFDPDNYSDGVGAWGPNGNYAKQWWGSEWGPDERTLTLMTTVVPVELTSFTASYVGTTTRLQWTTATEINNRGFEIQRSMNNSEFGTIAFVPGNGTTTSPVSYSYIDNGINPVTNYSYRLKQLDFNGNAAYSDVIELGASNPVDFNLAQNYPNPFNPATKFSFSLPVKSNITLDVYNLIGQKVMSLASGNYEAGTYDINVNGSALTSGIYVYTLNVVGDDGIKFSTSKKMIVLK